MALNEDILVQETTADYLQRELGWESVTAYNAETFGPEGSLGRVDDREVVLTRYLGEALVKLNPGLSETAYQEALRQILAVSVSQSPLQINQEKDKLLRDGVQVAFKNDKGERVKQRLRVIDFDNPDNNHFLIVREMWVKGALYRRRPDLIGFVNGLPLIWMEMKAIHKDTRAAFEKNLADYRDTIPHLFHHNAILLLGNGVKAKIGTLSSQYGHFHEWKRLEEEAPGVVDMETLLKGICDRRNLLDILENFILWDESRQGPPIKILARNHQYLGVNRAMQAVAERRERRGRLGVFWHTQGSGKSYSMVFFTRKARRKLGGHFTFLILTDRDDLDSQIYKTFAGCGLVDNDRDTCRADSGAHLRALFGQRKGFVFSLIQKFNQDVDPANPYSDRDDIIVITDEAHRTQYGRLALNLRNALPNAAFIGFTGTPLFKDDEITSRVFGQYVSTYDFQRAVDDNATVPLYYDARGDRLRVATDDLNERVAEKLESLEIDDIDVAQKLEMALKNDYELITAPERLEQIARDFVDHYARAWETGKAMFVCIDKVTCVRMYDLVMGEKKPDDKERKPGYWHNKITELEKEANQTTDDQQAAHLRRQIAWMREIRMAVVVSEEQGEVAKFKARDLDITPHRALIKNGFETPDGQRIDVETAFKRQDHPLRVAFVCAMWLTGFDVPSLSTLYLDKPLKAHTLMQAIARANRVHEGKNNGLIVDYCGILRNLRQALATFAGTGGNGGGDNNPNPVKPDEELLADLAEAIDMVRGFLEARESRLDDITELSGFARNAAILKAKEAANENDESRKRFEIMARAVFRKFKACIPLKERVNPYRHAYDAINVIYKKLQEDREKADITDIIRDLHRVVDETIDTTTRDQGADPEPYDISRIDFERLKKEFERSPAKNSTVQSLKDVVEKRLQRMLRQNPLRSDLQRHYEKIVEAYNREKDRATIERTFEELLKFTACLDEEEQRAVREGLDEASLALFDLLAKPDISKKERERVKQVARELLAKVRAEVERIHDWRERQATRDAVRQEIHDFLYADDTGLPVDSYAEEEVEAMTERIFHHVFQSMPEPLGFGAFSI
ncbi:MAG: type I restriction endonuclease subunit R [Magnetococcales bacterium]|nr:type I restriction endonuclease subunit R [Magnetococcales bacterium]